jgi:phosphohistidine phosphatase
MKQVVIVRHAKSVPYGYDDDFNRDLRDRGVNDAALVSRECKNRGIVPDVMISSPALRAIRTARIFAEHLDYPADRIIEKEDIYDGMTTGEFIEMIRQLPENAETAFFFGHNPGFLHYISNLLGHSNYNLPTSTATGILFPAGEWTGVEARSGKLSFRITPGMLK